MQILAATSAYLGNDELDGGPGKDMLTGSAGADIFKCDQFDKILDFESTEGDIKIGPCSAGNKSLPPLS